MADITSADYDYRGALITRRNKAARKLAALDEINLDLPNAPSRVDYELHKRGLLDEIDRLNVMIASAGGGFEIAFETDT